ncbi:MAG: hypothetical protein JWM11_6433 [Planctomycetaceae bacterium]|nr:hypothetical protein [Planctomycetaceae bacterium]
MSRKDRYKKKLKAEAVKSGIYAKSPSSGLNGSYVIVNHPIIYPWMTELPDEVEQAEERFNHLAQTSPSRAIPELLELIERYPQVPTFHNYLLVAYQGIGDYSKARKLIPLTFQQFPDYLFARVNYVSFLMQSGNLRKAGQLLDGKFTIDAHYPDRTEFHVTEIAAFNSIVGVYLANTGRHAEACQLYRVLRSVAPRHHLTAVLREELEQLDSFEIEKAKPTGMNSEGDTSGERRSWVKELLARLLGRI